jgi:deoxyribonuclease-4
MENEETTKLSRALGMPVSEIKSRRKIVLENSAGEGNKLGKNLMELGAIIQSIDPKYQSQVKVCIDTAHIFASGEYDLGKPQQVVQFFVDFNQYIGLDHLEVFHLNDSKVPFGSKSDRHINLGLGHEFSEGRKGLKYLLEEASYLSVPLIGEPPEQIVTSDEEGKPCIWDLNFIKEVYPTDPSFIC